MSVSEAERISLSYAETFQDHAVPHRIFSEFRATEPVAWCPEPWGGPGFWSVTTYDRIQEISKLPNIFSSDAVHGGITLPSPEMIANRRNLDREEVENPEELSQFQGGRSMITMDPPEHNENRRLVAPGFTPQTLDNLTPHIRQRAVEILDSLEGRRCLRIRLGGGGRAAHPDAGGAFWCTAVRPAQAV